MNKGLIMLTTSVGGVVGGYLPALVDLNGLGWGILGGLAGGIIGIWIGVKLADY